MRTQDLCLLQNTFTVLWKKNALEWLDHFDFMTFLQPKWGKKLIIKLGRILTFLQSVVSALTTDFFSYESFKSCVGELEPKSYMILGHAHWHFPEAFSIKLQQQSNKKKIIFWNANLLMKNHFQDWMNHSKGIFFAFIYMPWRVCATPMTSLEESFWWHHSWLNLSCSVQTDKLADVNQSLSDNNLSNFKKGFKLTFCSKVGLSIISSTHWVGFTGLEAFLKITSPTWKNGKKRPLFAVKNEIRVRYGLMAFFTPLEKDVWCILKMQ